MLTVCLMINRRLLRLKPRLTPIGSGKCFLTLRTLLLMPDKFYEVTIFRQNSRRKDDGCRLKTFQNLLYLIYDRSTMNKPTVLRQFCK